MKKKLLLATLATLAAAIVYLNLNNARPGEGFYGYGLVAAILCLISFIGYAVVRKK